MTSLQRYNFASALMTVLLHRTLSWPNTVESVNWEPRCALNVRELPKASTNELRASSTLLKQSDCSTEQPEPLSSSPLLSDVSTARGARGRSSTRCLLSRRRVLDICLRAVMNSQYCILRQQCGVREHLLQRHVSKVDQLYERPKLPIGEQSRDVHFAKFGFDAVDAASFHVAHAAGEEGETDGGAVRRPWSNSECD